MLKISVHHEEGNTVLVLEGRLEAPWVPELENAEAIRGLSSDHDLVTIDLCGLTGMDALGESTLRDLFRRGASLRCADVMNEFFVERMTREAANASEIASRPCHAPLVKAS